MKLPNSLFFRTASTLVVTLLLLIGVTLASLAWFVVIPVGKQSADDLAALVIFSAQTWVELPPETRPDLEQELFDSHRIKLIDEPLPLVAYEQSPPYLGLLEQAIRQRLGDAVVIGHTPQYPGWFWLEIPMAGHDLHIGFPHERIGARPPVALAIIAVAIVLLAIITALLLAHRIASPLAMLSRATTLVGQGKKHQIVLPHGPDELTSLTHNFNAMSKQVSEMLENRTTLLAGISHDLRTPLTRLRLSLELLPASVGDEVSQQLIEEVDEIDRLLRETLLLARGVQRQETAEALDLPVFIREVVSAYQHDALMIEVDADTPVVRSLARDVLKRVLQNLLDNAIRYGQGRPVAVRLRETADAGVEICVQDQGPGIPAAEREAVFRPFYRLEASRNQDTGGSGLGLAIVQQLCAAQGWTITLHPAQGGGTLACLQL